MNAADLTLRVLESGAVDLDLELQKLDEEWEREYSEEWTRRREAAKQQWVENRWKLLIHKRLKAPVVHIHQQNPPRQHRLPMGARGILERLPVGEMHIFNDVDDPTIMSIRSLIQSLKAKNMTFATQVDKLPVGSNLNVMRES